MVDMSPSAVTQRLRLMEELWELSVALMNSKKVPSVERSAEEITQRLDDDKRTSQNREQQRRKLW